MVELLADSMIRRKVVLALMATFAGVALLLAAIGTYGVMNVAASERVREIGIRMALGAQRRDIERLIVRPGVVLAVAGVAAGRRAHRRADLRRRFGAAHPRRDRGLLRSRAPRDEARSPCRAPHRIAAQRRDPPLRRLVPALWCVRIRRDADLARNVRCDRPRDSGVSSGRRAPL
jgi:hypothetical protein